MTLCTVLLSLYISVTFLSCSCDTHVLCWNLPNMSSTLLCPHPRREEGIIDWAAVSPICPSVCGVPRLNSRTERPRKPKIGRMVACHTCIPWTYLEVKRSKVKVTRPVNAHTVNAQYLPNGKAYELQTWCTDGARRVEDPHQRQAPWPLRSKVKVARSRDASDRFWPISRERNVPETSKLVGRLSMPWAIMHTSFKIKGQRSRSPGRHNVYSVLTPSGELRGKGKCGVFAGKTVWSTPDRLRCEVLTTRRYTNQCLPLPLPTQIRL